jgi:ubiquinone/menaquinone biosynthesis C-methylase UbiE
MDRNDKINGSAEEFDASWKIRKESHYNHWTAGVPKNQVQFAFRQHWKVFQSFIDGIKPGRSLEVGCGRGSISSYFADAGWNTVLLDWSSAILEIAEKIFVRNGHKASFVCGDAYNLSFQNEEFDVVISIGLFEHFQNVEQPLGEQWRVLRPGGWFFGYIVPDNPHSIQKYFNWVAPILKHTVGRFEREKNKSEAKEELYRNDFFSKTYVFLLEKYDPQEILELRKF